MRLSPLNKSIFLFVNAVNLGLACNPDTRYLLTPAWVSTLCSAPASRKHKS